MKKILSIVLCAALLLTFCAGAFSADDKTLRFKNGEFKILVLSDTQDDHYPAYDMVNLITLAIEETSPDLIVFTGDLVEDSRAGDIGIDGESFREPEDMAYEWIQHNIAYNILPDDNSWKANAKDVDINPADQNKSLYEMYKSKTGGDLLE